MNDTKRKSIFSYDKFLIFNAHWRYTVFNVTFKQYSNECGQLSKTFNEEVFDQILLFFDALFVKGEELKKKYKIAENLQCS